MRHALYSALGALASRHVVETRARLFPRDPQAPRVDVLPAALVASALPIALVDRHYAGALALAAGTCGAAGYLAENPDAPREGLPGCARATLERIPQPARDLAAAGVGGLAAAITLQRRARPGSVIDVLVDAALIAGVARLATRLEAARVPALTAVGAATAPLALGASASTSIAGAVLASAAAERRREPGGRGCAHAGGVAALGAGAGLAVAARGRRAVRVAAAAATLALAARARTFVVPHERA